MGCSLTKGKVGHAKPSVTISLEQITPTANNSDGPFPQTATHANPGLTSHAMESILRVTNASNEQIKFFYAWNEIVLKKCEGSGSESANVILSTDLSFLEIRITGPAEKMFDLVDEFVTKCNVRNNGEPNTLIEEMKQLTDVTPAAKATLWCKFKNMSDPSDEDRKNAPSVDAGFIIASDQIDWIVADMLMPAIDDQDALRDYAVQELHAPNMIGSSIFPVEPEKVLCFEMSGGISKKLLLSAFFFFKSLGFAKPEDAVVRILGSCQSPKFIISVFMGPKGLTRLVVSLCEPTRPIANELAECLRRQYRKESIERIIALLKNANVDFIDYAADCTGYSVGLGFAFSGYEAG